MDRLSAISEFLKTLAGPTRIQILRELRNGELNVSELSNRMKVELPNVSQQLALLKSQHLVVARKHGSNIYHSCLNHKVFEILDCVESLIADAKEGSNQ